MDQAIRFITLLKDLTLKLEFTGDAKLQSISTKIAFKWTRGHIPPPNGSCDKSNACLTPISVNTSHSASLQAHHAI